MGVLLPDLQSGAAGWQGEGPRHRPCCFIGLTDRDGEISEDLQEQLIPIPSLRGLGAMVLRGEDILVQCKIVRLLGSEVVWVQGRLGAR